MRWLAVVAFSIVAASCGDDNDACNAPDHTVYDCAPLPAGAAGCVGGPLWTDRDGVMHQDDLDKTFPDRCHASIPECSPFYKSSPRGFVCYPDGHWSELL